MTSPIKRLLFCLAFIMTCTAGMQAQTFYEENPAVMQIFRELDKMFPKHYLTRRDISRGQYWLIYIYEDQEDYKKHQPKLWEIFKKLNKLPALHKYVEEIDSADVQAKHYSMTFPTQINGQTDYLSLSTDNNRLRFFFLSQNKLIVPNANPLPDQKVVAELESLLKEYLSRPDVRMEDVTYKGNVDYGQYEDFENSRRNVSGRRYIVRNCSEKDYQRFYALFHKYIKKDYVFAASHDVYWDYDECTVRVRQSNGRPLFMSAALKGNDLYLLRAEGTPDGGGALPRAWAEDNPVWEKTGHMGGWRHSKK